MLFKIAFFRSASSVVLREFKKESGTVGEIEEKTSISEKIIQIDDLLSEGPDLLIYPEGLSNEIALDFIEKYRDQFPIIEEKFLNTDETDFLNWDQKIANKNFEDILSKWTLKNNLSLIENFFPIIKKLKEIATEDRSLFFQEIWYLLKKNMGTGQLKIIYFDVENEGKNKLVEMLVEGRLQPSVAKGGIPEKKLMESYKLKNSQNFQIAEFNEVKGEMLILGQLENTPVLVLATLFSFSKLQNVTTKLIFDAFYE